MKVYSWLSLIFLAYTGFSQNPSLIWNKTYGGSQTELVGSFATTSLFFGRWASVDSDTNNQIYIATTSNSNDNDLLTNFGEEDVWVLSINEQGDTLWTFNLGGAKSERVLRVKAKTGGGCYVVGNSRSSNGLFAENHTNDSYADGFVASLDASGNLLWNRMFGGSSDDFLYDIIETSDGELMACGETLSNDGDLINTGAGMNWIIKINPINGSLLWSNAYLGPDATSNDRLENVFRLAQMSDNSVVLTGYTTPDFNDFNLDRIHLMKITLSGSLVWTIKIGAEGGGDYPCAILPAENGSFYVLSKLVTNVGGTALINNYYGGGGDFWLVKLDASGQMLFEKNYGGSNLDVPYDMKYAADGSLYLVGMTRSEDFDANIDLQGMSDFWLLKVDALNGTAVYTKRFGGSSNDFCSGMTITQNGNSLVLVGGTDSNNGIIDNNFGVRDLWVLRLMYDTELGIKQNDAFEVALFPNPTKSIIHLGTDPLTFYDLKIFDINGRLLQETEQINLLNIEYLSNGTYLLSVKSHNSKVFSTQLIIKH